MTAWPLQALQVISVSACVTVHDMPHTVLKRHQVMQLLMSGLQPSAGTSCYDHGMELLSYGG
jgi:hypothetical protein